MSDRVCVNTVVGFPYLLLTMHFYVKPPRSTRAGAGEQSGLQDRLNKLG
jgi:hypothetical protein